ncbi:hypothetical protein [Rhodococcus opacus]|uniref:hypothetical protein n=1 Tax=Rhodococcus opacus TaxID=37919 RepID=UPI00155A623A|nr:hypothetical protein [Rhodococcus opacus]
MNSNAALPILQADANWSDAITALRDLAERGGTKARQDAESYAAVYAGCRGAMVVDVVASRQRRYDTRVQNIVTRWKTSNQEHSMAWLADHPLDHQYYGLQATEADTIGTIAKNLRQFADSEGLAEDDDAACRLWATRVDCVEHAPRLDPIVGSVKGIGPALFAYLRMRSGADALKVDVRVKKSLKRLGFTVPADDHAVMIIVKAVAEEVDLPVLALDQLLWHME